MPTDKQKAGIATSTVSEAMMTGGWRLPFDAALCAILNCLGSLARPGAPLTFVFRVLAEQERVAAIEIASWKGVPLP